MGRVRSWDFDAVIGVGGKHPNRGHEDLARKINWIGLRPHWKKGRKGHLVTFDRFCLWEEKGPPLKEIAPRLYKYMYKDANVRVVLSKSRPPELQKEIQDILDLAQNAQARIKYGLPLSKERTHAKRPGNPKICKSSCSESE
jgi:hypothetical protein